MKERDTLSILTTLAATADMYAQHMSALDDYRPIGRKRPIRTTTKAQRAKRKAVKQARKRNRK